MKELEIRIPPKQELKREDVVQIATKAMGVSAKMIGEYEVLKKSLDARGGVLNYRYQLRVYLNEEKKIDKFILNEYKDVTNSKSVIIVGAGPAGIFAGLRLLQQGLKPVILERGKDIHARKIDIAAMSQKHLVNEDSNYCFGEGGAGTFSDGKLYTRSSKRGDIREVLQQLVNFGADPSILIDAHPHIGSDKLPRIIEAIRNKIIEMGGEYHFNSKVIDIVRSSNQWRVDTVDGKTYESESLILATGHSARDIYRLFQSKDWALEAKGFALGVRVEHPQSLINKIQYNGKFVDYLPAAEYSLVTQVENRGVFSFCMCPGGILIPSSTEPGEIVLNGMSNSSRNSRWANSGIVVSVNPGDIPEYDQYGVFALLEFQQSIERAAFAAVNPNGTSFLKAPAQRMTDFAKAKQSANLPKSSYTAGLYSLPLNEILPEHISKRLKVAFRDFDKKMRGFFTEEALLLGIESRTSSPIRIVRDPDTLEHIQLSKLYPCGEGAGYAGGIVSSALDGIRVAGMIK